jgi:3-oxoacyl-[acyl-carrier protein] reductase
MAQDILGLSGKMAIVWGGGAGMGEATARRLAEAGCKVAVVDLELERAQHVAAGIVAAGYVAAAFCANATCQAEVEAALAGAEASLGPVDVMATVIGVGVWSSLLDMSQDIWEQSLDLNLTSFFLPAQAVARSLVKGGRPGAIACVSSVSGMTSSPNNAGYGAAKAGMINLIRTMAVEWGAHGIRVNAIAPGSINTPRLNMGPEALAAIGDRLPLGRAGEVDDIAKGVLFLLSDLAGYVTGHNLPVDGGWMSCFLMDKGSRSRAGAELAPLDGRGT